MSIYRSKHRPLRPVPRMGVDTRSRTPALYDTAAHPGHFDTYLSPPFKRYGTTPKADAYHTAQLQVTSSWYPSRSRDSHGGLDIGTPNGVPIFAMAPGKVISVVKQDWPTDNYKPHLNWPSDYVREGSAADDRPGGVGRAAQDDAHDAWLVTPAPSAVPGYSAGLTGQQKLDAYQAQEDAVRAAGYEVKRCGNHVAIDYDPAPDGTLYRVTFCHMRDGRYSPGGFKVASGQRVTRGQLLGYVGGVPAEWGTGNSTGAHLHMTMKRKGPGETSWSNVDPVGHVDWFPFALKYPNTSHSRKYRPKDYSDELALAAVEGLNTARDAQIALASHNTARSGENLSADPSAPIPPVITRRATVPAAVSQAGFGGGSVWGVVAGLAGVAALVYATHPERMRKRLKEQP